MTDSVTAIFRPALVLMTGRFVGFVAAFAIPLLLARTFSQSEFGTYKQLFLVFSTLFGIAQLGMAESLYFFLPREAGRRSQFVLNALVVLGLTGGLSMLLLWGLRGVIADLLNNPDLAQYLPWIGLYLLFMLMAVLLEIVLTARKHHLGASCAYAFSDLARAVLYITPVLLFGNLTWLLIGAVMFAGTRFCATVFALRHELRGHLSIDRVQMKKHLGYALPFALAALIEIMHLNSHLYVVSYTFDPAAFAVYAVGCLQLPIVDFLMTSTANVMMVAMGEKISQGKTEDVMPIWCDAVRKLALVVCPLVCCLIITAPELITVLFTETYAESIPVFMVWSAGMLFSILMTDGMLRVFADTRFLIFKNLLRLVLIIAFIKPCMNAWGLPGAVMAVLMATLVTKIVTMVRISNLLEVSFRNVLPWGSLVNVFLITAMAAVPALALKAALTLSDLQLLLLMGAVYSLTYYLLVLLFAPLRHEEKTMLVQWTQAPVMWLYGK